MSPDDREELIYGEDEHDDSFVWNQKVTTIGEMEIKGDTIYFYPTDYEEDEPYGVIQQKLQKAFDSWVKGR